jgi:hypothetical protein
MTDATDFHEEQATPDGDHWSVWVHVGRDNIARIQTSLSPGEGEYDVAFLPLDVDLYTRALTRAAVIAGNYNLQHHNH